MMSITKSEANERIEFVNKELLQKYFDQGKTIVGVTGHIGNWEWVACLGLTLQTPYHIIPAAMTQSNKSINDLIISLLRTMSVRLFMNSPIVKRELD